MATPADGATAGSPVSFDFTCAATTGHNIVGVRIYVTPAGGTTANPYFSGTTTGNSVHLTTSIAMALGANSVIVQAWDDSAPQIIYKTPLTVNVVDPGCVVHSPANGATVSSPFTVDATCTALGGHDIVAVDVYDGVQATPLSHTVTSGNSVHVTPTNSDAAGTYPNMIVQAWDDSSPQNIYKTPFSIVVSAPPPSSAGCTVASPASGATVATPVALNSTCTALAGHNIVAIHVYVDGNSLWQQPFNSNQVTVTPSVYMAQGARSVIVQAWDDSAPQNIYKTPFSLTLAGGTDPVFAGAGDVACGAGGAGQVSVANGGCHESNTANTLRGLSPSFVWAAGDLQYNAGAQSDFDDNTFGWNGTWGIFNPILRPAIGNHEYNNCAGTCTDNTVAPGYVAYFTGEHRASIGQGNSDLYYSFDIPTLGRPWHVIVLDTGKCYGGAVADQTWCNGYTGSCNTSNTGQTGSCTCPPVSSTDSRQNNWLCNDLASHKKAAFGGAYAGIIAIWHQPRFASASQGDDFNVIPIWNMLYNYKADVVLNGHAHFYERYDPTGHVTSGNNPTVADPNGIREFIVGTGGVALNTPFSQPPHASPHTTSAFQIGAGASSGLDTYGVLKMTLHDASFDAAFVNTAGTVLDSVTAVSVH